MSGAKCTKYQILQKQESYTVRVMAVVLCIKEGISYEKSLKRWERFISEAEDIWYKDNSRNILDKIFNLSSRLKSRNKFPMEYIIMTLSKYLMYDDYVYYVNSQGATMLFLRGKKGYINFRNKKSYTMDELLKKYGPLGVWVNNELYAAICTYLLLIGRYKVENNSRLEIFKYIFPQNEFTKKIGFVFEEEKKFLNKTGKEVINLVKNPTRMYLPFLSMTSMGCEYLRTVRSPLSKQVWNFQQNVEILLSDFLAGKVVKKLKPKKEIRKVGKIKPGKLKIYKNIPKKISCDSYKLLSNIKSYCARVMCIMACLEDNIPLRAAISIWERWVSEARKVWNKYKTQYSFRSALSRLYNWIQTTNKRQGKIYAKNHDNFISSFYLKGSCNCDCGASLLFALGPYLGYEEKVVYGYVPGHALLFIPDGDKYIPFDTVFQFPRYIGEKTNIQGIIKKYKGINSWTNIEKYGAVVLLNSKLRFFRGRELFSKSKDDLTVKQKYNIFNGLFGKEKDLNILFEIFLNSGNLYLPEKHPFDISSYLSIVISFLREIKYSQIDIKKAFYQVDKIQDELNNLLEKYLRGQIGNKESWNITKKKLLLYSSIKLK